MSKYFLLFAVVIALVLPGLGQSVSVYQTTPDMSQKLQQKSGLTFSGSGTASQTITIDDTKTYQQIDGFGASFTDSSAWLVYTKLTDAQRADAMQKLFSRDNGIALSFIRQPMGASDLALNFYTYDDMPAGQTDPTLANFSIDHDKAYIIPVLKEALALNPNIKMMATPWSPPAWMKTNNSLIGSPGGVNGSLKSDAYGPLANYFVKYIQAYEAEGIKTDYISMQNEPLYAPPGYTGMLMDTGNQITLLNTYLAPALTAAGLKTKVMLYDHNWDRSDYPTTQLANATVRANVAGVAWHHYAGNSAVMSTVHDLHPEFDAWETEASGGTWQTGNILMQEGHELVNTMRNWGKSYVLWNMALDQDRGPVAKTTDGQHGCDTCRGIITINWDKSGGSGASTVTQELDYYVLGHASKFLQAGAYRIFSDENVAVNLYDVAFRNPDGSIVVYAVNGGSSDITFNVKYHSQYFTATITAGSIATYKWTPATTPVISLTQLPNGITITAGQTGNMSVIAQPVNGATPHVTLSCTVTDQAGTATTKASCSTVPANMTFSDSTPQSIALTITTAKTSGALQNRPGHFGWTSGLSMVAVLGGVLLGAPARRRLLMLGVIGIGLMLVTVSCGGGGGASVVTPPPPPPPPPAVTSATYLVNVTATPDTGAATTISIQTLVN